MYWFAGWCTHGWVFALKARGCDDGLDLLVGMGVSDGIGFWRGLDCRQRDSPAYARTITPCYRLERGRSLCRGIAVGRAPAATHCGRLASGYSAVCARRCDALWAEVRRHEGARGSDVWNIQRRRCRRVDRAG